MYAHKIRYKGTKKIQYTQIKTQNFIFFAFFFKKIWSVQKKAVPLHPLSKIRIIGAPENFNFWEERRHRLPVY